ncbi:MAG: hypothetical protein EGR48_07345 [Lachnospiraceae bacterium]|nr:hypothetical protein [Lachnospiraceae bacterium]
MSLFFSDFIHTRTDLTQKISDIQQQLNHISCANFLTCFVQMSLFQFSWVYADFFSSEFHFFHFLIVLFC